MDVIVYRRLYVAIGKEEKGRSRIPSHIVKPKLFFYQFDIHGQRHIVTDCHAAVIEYLIP
jgi:hypothetical protein